MSGVITAVAVTGLAGAAIGANASKKAGETQAKAATQASESGLAATRETNALNWQMYQQNLRNQAPYMQGGGQAFGALMAGMGLDPTSGSAGPRPIDDGRMRAGGGSGLVDTSTPAGRMRAMSVNPSLATIAGRVAGAATGQPQTLSALSGYQDDTTQNYGATPEQLAAAERTYGGNGGKFTQTFGSGDLGLDPSYQFRLNEGTRNLNASAAARGMVGSGQNLKDITNYGQGAASQEYQAAYDRFMNNQTTQYNRLAGLAGVGQNAAAGVGNAGMQTGQNIAQNTMSGVNSSNQMLTSGAAAQAAGQVGVANAVNSGINNGMNTWMGMQYLNKNNNFANRPVSDQIRLSDGTIFTG